ncbi:sugar phosphate isomerase/epimerase [uncultured Jannaschia sp.]|uniref:sugar phosphate isomerase/epimerase family protein n=1 Tax=uncultured Jannaschia sp. TaxID=293347 RepID=UPI0026157091|nr:sugar phosphate isomerase/epimerase [uncultured Jannaschia sp.]
MTPHFRTLRQTAMTAVAGMLAVAGANTAAAATVGPQIAAQTYSLRAFGTLEEQMRIIKDAGVDYVEAYGGLGAASDARAVLDAAGLTAISDHVGLADLRADAANGLASVIARQRTLGNDTVVMPYLVPDDRPADAAGWAALGRELGGYADRLAEEGLTFGYHNHDFDLVAVDGSTGYEIAIAAGGPNLKAQVDVGWAERAGVDPTALLQRLNGKVISIHAKDLADPADPGPTAGGREAFGFDFAAVGEGLVDWDSVLPAALDAGAEWFIIEHDFPPDPFEVISTGQTYLAENLPEPAPVPLPAGLPLLAGGLLGLGVLRRRAR